MFSCIIPILLLIIIFAYRHIKKKNLEIEAKEKRLYFAELEEQRQKILQKMYADQHQRELEIYEYLEQQEKELDKQFPSLHKPNIHPNVTTDGINREKIDHGDSTDEELFEMPLPPIPNSPISTKSGQASIIDNEQTPQQNSPLMPMSIETPKLQNVSVRFRFPPKVNYPAPPPPIIVKANDPPSLPATVSPIQRESTLPFIVEVHSKSLLQSDF